MKGMIFSVFLAFEFLLLGAFDLDLVQSDFPSLNDTSNKNLENSEEILDNMTNCQLIETRLYTRISILNLKLLKLQQNLNKKVENFQQQIPQNFNSTIETLEKKLVKFEQKLE